MIQHAAPTRLIGQFICRACKHIHTPSEIWTKEVDERFTVRTSYRPGHKLDPRDPSDAQMIPIWNSIYREVLDDQGTSALAACSRCDATASLTQVQSWEEWKGAWEAGEWLLRDDTGISAQLLAEYERLGVLKTRYVAFSNALAAIYNRQEIARFPRGQPFTHRAPDGSFVPDYRDDYLIPGVITQLEFRVRYGYECRRRRAPCALCQQHQHSHDSQDGCKIDEGSGTRYYVTRFDGTIVSVELSAKVAWTTAFDREQERFAPLLLARDAIIEKRFDEARQIADQLSPDLAIPLRREITNAVPNAPVPLNQLARNAAAEKGHR